MVNTGGKYQTWLLVTFAGIAGVILVISFLRASRAQLNAQLGMSSPSPVTKSALPAASRVPQHGDYVLPSPGMLPTHPLYALKMVHDRIGLILMRSPEQKAEALLLYSDKRLAAARQLYREGMGDVAISVATKGEAYFWQAISISNELSPAERPGWFDRLKLASLKHEEILEELRQSTHAPVEQQAGRLYQNISDYRQEIINLSGQAFGYLRPEDIVPDQASAVSASPSAALTPQL